MNTVTVQQCVSLRVFSAEDKRTLVEKVNYQAKVKEAERLSKRARSSSAYVCGNSRYGRVRLPVTSGFTCVSEVSDAEVTVQSVPNMEHMLSQPTACSL